MDDEDGLQEVLLGGEEPPHQGPHSLVLLRLKWVRIYLAREGAARPGVVRLIRIRLLLLYAIADDGVTGLLLKILLLLLLIRGRRSCC